MHKVFLKSRKEKLLAQPEEEGRSKGSYLEES